MNKAFIFINVDEGNEKLVYDKLKSISGIKNAYLVQGVYDLIIYIEELDRIQLIETIALKIRKIPEINSTLTLLAVG